MLAKGIQQQTAGGGVDAILLSHPAVRRCLRDLTRLGIRQGGYVAMQTLVDGLRGTGCQLSLDDVDRIHEYLRAHRIAVVDVPSSQRIAATSALRSRDGQAAPRKRAHHREFRHQASSSPPVALCPEEGIDRLLLAAESGSLSDRVFETIIALCQLSETEVAELAEYLSVQGVDVPGLEVLLWGAPRQATSVRGRASWWLTLTRSVGWAREPDRAWGSQDGSPIAARRETSSALLSMKTRERKTWRYVRY